MESVLKQSTDVSTLWILKQSAGYFLMWATMFISSYILIPIKGTTRHVADIHTRVVGLIHGVICCFFSTYFLVVYPFNLEMPMNFFGCKILVFSFGYFLYDLLVCVPFDLVDKKLLLHHSACWIIFGTILYTRNGMYLGIGTLSFGEASNCPLGTRAILRQFGLKHTKIYEIMEGIYFVMYIITRGIMSPIMFVFAVKSGITPLIVKMAVGLALVQSLFFVKIMVRMIKKKYRSYIERKQKNVELFWFSVNPEVKELAYFKAKQGPALF